MRINLFGALKRPLVAMLAISLWAGSCDHKQVLKITSLTVSPTNITLEPGVTQQFTATATYSDNTTKDITSETTWSVEKPGVAVFQAATPGLLKGVDEGTTKVTALATGGATAIASVTVHDSARARALAITPAIPKLASGTTQQLTATATFDNNVTKDVTSSAQWSLADSVTASISPVGIVSGLKPGQVTATVVYGGLTATVKVTVLEAELTEIQIDPPMPQLAKGTSQTLTATGVFTDMGTQELTTQVLWTSSDEAIATVSNEPGKQGTVNAVAVGEVQLTATLMGVNAVFTVKVTPAVVTSLEVDPTTPTVVLGTKKALTATAVFSDKTTQEVTETAQWSSLDAAVASVAADGTLTAIGLGKTTITAVYMSKTISTEVTIVAPTLLSIALTSDESSIAKGTSTQFTAEGTYDDGLTRDITDSVAWDSSDALTVAVSNDPTSKGLATGLKVGSAKITASLGTVTSPELKLTVTAARLVSLAVSATSTTVEKGSTQAFTVEGTFTDHSTQDLTDQVAWTSFDPAVAAISNVDPDFGIATGLTVGTTDIEATLNGVTSPAVTLTVVVYPLVSIRLQPSATSVPKGLTLTFQAFGTYSNGAEREITDRVTWSSSAVSVAAISNASGTSGTVTGVSEGTTTITADLDSITSPPMTVTVAAPVLIGIGLVPLTVDLYEGKTHVFIATGTYSDNVQQPLSAGVTWASSNTAAATVDANGLVTAVGTGAAQITAKVGTVVSPPSTVNATRITGLAVTATNASIAKGLTQQFTATVTYGDSTTEDVTAKATWQSSNATVASITAAGLAKGEATGTASISATYALHASNNFALTIAPEALTAIDVSPTTPSVAAGRTQQFSALGHYTDGSTKDISSSATWATSAPSVATISSTGLATSKVKGSTSITAISGSISSTAVTFTVTDAVLVSIAVNPSSATMTRGTSKQFLATGTYSDATTADITTTANWSTTDSNFVTVTTGAAGGVAHAVAPGTVTLTATSGTVSSSGVTVTVPVPQVTSIALSPSSVTILLGTKQQFTATASYDDGSTADVTSTATWISSDVTVATIVDVAAPGKATAAGYGVTNITAKVNNVTSPMAVLTVPTPTLVSIMLSPSPVTVKKAASVQLTATGTYSDSSVKDLSAQVNWSSDATTTATVNTTTSPGLVTGVATGTTTVRATLGTVTSSVLVSVPAPALVSIALNPTAATVEINGTQQFTATGTYDDSSTATLTTGITWKSSDTSKVTITAAGLATAVAQGSADVTATVGSIVSPVATVTVPAPHVVSVTVNPSVVTIQRSSTKQFSALATYSDGATADVTSTATWLSQNAAVATISTGGLATAVAVGSSNITATFSSVTSTAAVLNVPTPTITGLTMAPTSATIIRGQTKQLAVTGTYSDGSTGDVTSSVTWSSNNQAVATVNGTTAPGLVSAVSPGSATVFATLSGQTASAAITVPVPVLQSLALVPTTATVEIHATQQFTATGTYDDGSTQVLTSGVTWQSSTTNVTITSGGLATAVSAGTANITAKVGSVTSPAAVVTVPAPRVVSVALTPVLATLQRNSTRQFTAEATYTDGSKVDVTVLATWATSNAGVASVTTTGLVGAVSVGSATITATVDGITSPAATVTVPTPTLTSLAIVPTSFSVRKSLTTTLVAMGTYSDTSSADVTSLVVWSTDDATIANVENGANAGRVTGIALGATTIHATLDGQAATSAVTVQPALLVSIAIEPSTANVEVGGTLQLTAKGTYEDGSVQTLSSGVTWSSSSEAKVTVNTTGLVTGVTQGFADITATVDSIASTPIKITVLPPHVVSVTVAPPTATAERNSTVQFSATARYSDNSTATVTSTATWATTDSTIATVSISGLATALAVGTTSITATFDGVTSTSAVLTVPTPTLASITIVPDTFTLVRTQKKQFVATGTYSDGSTSTITTQVTWSSGTPGVASIDSTGFATAVSAGTTTITATLAGKTGTATLTVPVPVLQSIALNPPGASLERFSTQTFTASGTYDDGSTSTITTGITWNSSDTSKVTISTAGVATAMAVGNADITATVGSVTSTPANVVVRVPTVVSVAVTPTTATIERLSTKQFQAIATYSDTSTADVTTTASWSSTNGVVATVSSAGLVTAAAVGTTTITATFDSVTSPFATVTVPTPTLVSIALNPTSLSIRKSLQKQFAAIGTFSDTSTSDITSQVVWTTDDATIANVENTPVAGRVTAVATGSTSIHAALDGKQASGAVTVDPAALASIAIRPVGGSVEKNGTTQFFADGTYEDGSTQVLVGGVTWASSDTSKVSVDSSGLVTGVAVGSATLTAAQGSITSPTVTITVLVPHVVSVTLNPTSATVERNASKTFAAIAHYSDSSNLDVSATATWASSTPSVATVSGTGVVTGVAIGTTTITATFDSITSTGAVVTVPTPTLVSVAINPTSFSVRKSLTQQIHAEGTFSDTSTADVTTQVVWTSDDATIANVGNGGSAGLVSGVALGSTVIHAALDGKTSASTVTVDAPLLVSIALTPSSKTLDWGATQQFSAVGTYEDTSTQTLTSGLTWASSDATKVTISDTGLATGVAQGSSNITVSMGTITSPAAPVTVLAPKVVSMEVTPVTATIERNGTQQYTAKAHYSDSSIIDVTTSASWSSSNTSVATINTNGLATAVAPGPTSIAATFDSVASTGVTLTVATPTVTSLTLSDTSFSIRKSQTHQLTATGTFSDGTSGDVTSAVTWSTDSASVATVGTSTNPGLVTGAGVGGTTIRATINGKNASADVTVTAPLLTSIALTPSSKTLEWGASQQFTATGTFEDASTQTLTTGLTWASSDETKVTVDSTGLATGVAQGSANITAMQGSITSPSAAVTVLAPKVVQVLVNPPGATVERNGTQQFTATAKYSDNSTVVVTSTATWATSQPSVATISSTGLATALSIGSTTITATFDGVTSTGVTLTVPTPTLTQITIAPSTFTLIRNTSKAYTATGKYSDNSTADITSLVSWASSNTGVATVNSSGAVTAVNPGDATITATLSSVTGTATVTVPVPVLQSIGLEPASVTLQLGGTQQFVATGSYDDGSTQTLTTGVTWASSNSTVATVNSSGLVTGASAGTADITAAVGAIISAPATTTVLAATVTSITLDPSSATIERNGAQQFVATAHLSNGTTEDVTATALWASSAPAVASISSSGFATAHTPGSTVVTATYAGVPSAGVTLTVATPTLLSLTLSKTSFTIRKSLTDQLTVTGTYSDATSADVTTQVVWTSDDALIANVGNGGSGGLVTGTGVGSTTIHAALSGKSASASVTVDPALLLSIALTPTSATVQRNATQQFVATGTYEDGTVIGLGSVTWASSDSSKVSINSSGLATAAAIGSANITATVGSVTSPAATVTVPVPTVVSVQVSPTTASIERNGTQSFTAQALYSDASSVDVTSSATWASSNSGVATIVSGGLATAVAPGTTTITATKDGVPSSGVTLTVLSPTLQSMVLSTTSFSIRKSQTHQLTVTGTFSDGSTSDITSQVVWTSDDASVANVNNGGSAGLVTGTGVGSTTIHADKDGKTASATVTVDPAALVSITLEPTGAVLPWGGSQQFVATGHYEDSSSQTLGGGVTWASTNASKATVSSSGFVQAVAAGSTDITAAIGAIVSAPATVVVQPPVVVSVTISPTSSTLFVNNTVTFTANAHYSDNSDVDVTSTATWNTTASTVLTIGQSGAPNVGTAVGAGTATVTASFGGKTSTGSLVTVQVPVLTSLVITPDSSSLKKNLTQQLALTAHYSDSSSFEAKTLATWTSSNPTIASVANGSSGGLVTTLTPGTVTITATYDGGTATASITVLPADLLSLTLSPGSQSMTILTTQQFTVIGLYDDSTTGPVTSGVTWQTTDATKVSISATGLATALALGSSNITATVGSLSSAPAVVTVLPPTLVSVSIAQPSTSVGRGQTYALTALAHYSNNTTVDVTSSAQWTSSATSVATVDSSGLVTAVMYGSTNITAAYGGFTSAPVIVTVPVPAVTSFVVSPSSATVIRTHTVQLSASITYADGYTDVVTNQASWSTSDVNIATVGASSSYGLVTAVATGSVTITATFAGQTSTSAITVPAPQLVSIALNPSSASLPAGRSQQFTATGTYDDTSTATLSSGVTWASSSTAAVTINSGGLAHAAAVGTSNITATVGSITSTAAVFTVTPAVIDSIAVTPTSATLEVGGSVTLMATATMSDGQLVDISSSATWVSSIPETATVNASGTVVGVDYGHATITASKDGKTSAEVEISVPAPTVTALSVSTTSTTVKVGLTRQVTATATLSNGQTLDASTVVVWTSSDATVATVGNEEDGGLVTAVHDGTAVITATVAGFSASVTITVPPPLLQAIEAQIDFPWLPTGISRQLSVVGYYEDGSTRPITTNLYWESIDTTLVSVSETGLATGLSAGSAMIYVQETVTGVSYVLNLNIDTPIVTSITLNPSTISIAKGDTQQLTVTGTLSDGTTANVTADASFTFTTSGIVSVNASGLLSTVAQGTTSVTAKVMVNYPWLPFVTSTASVTVGAPVVRSIAVSTASTVPVPKGLTATFSALATLSDGTTQDVTNSVTWSSSNAGVLSLQSGSTFKAQANTGSTTVTATLGGITGTSSAIAVTDPTLSSIISSPSSIASLPKGTTQQLTISGVYSDGSSTALANNASSYVSSATGVATVSASGLVTGVAATGSATITVTYSGKTTTVSVTAAAAVPSSIQVRLKNYSGAAPGPTAVSIDTNMFQDLAVFATMSDGTTSDVTGTASFSSGTPANATVTGNRVVGVATGPSVITATVSALTATYTVTVKSTTCHVVINEVQVAGTSNANDEWIELYNPCSTSQSVAGWTLQYRSQSGTSDTQLIAIAAGTTMASGGFLLYVGSSYSGTPTATATFATGALSGSNGGVGLKNGSTLIDAVGWGSGTTNIYVEGGSTNVAPAPGGGSSIIRFPTDGTDTNINKNDFKTTTTTTPKALNL